MPVFVVLVVVGLALAVEKIGWVGVVLIALALMIALGLVMDQSNKAQQRKLDEVKDHINDILRRNEGLVDRTALHTLKTSHMGVVNAERFHKEIIEFLQVHVGSHIHDYFAKIGTKLPAFYRAQMADAVARNAISRIEGSRQVSTPVADMTPIEYEFACADLFKARGWTVEMTPATGDQGVDIVIQKGEKKGVVQCKRYTAPVGNGAVQEIAAGKFYYRASLAIVVSPSGFTRSARQLAESTGVYLLHHEEIPKFSV